MKNPLPVTLDDLQATAKDDIGGSTTYRKIVVAWNPQTNLWAYWHEGFPCNKEFVIRKLAEFNRW